MKGRSFFVLVGLLAASAGAQSVLFDFENATAGTSLPITLTVGGITADFSATSTSGGGFYIQQPQNVIGVTPSGFSGNCLNPTGNGAADLHVSFSQTLMGFSILYAPQELSCDTSATMSVTAYQNGTLVGSATTNATALCPCTWQSQTLAITSAQGFNSVVIHYVAPGGTCQEYGTIFVADNMVVTPAPPPLLLSSPTRRADGAFQFTFSYTSNATCSVFGTTNPTLPFSNWTPLAGLTEAPPGQYQFTDLEATNIPSRFYRVSSP